MNNANNFQIAKVQPQDVAERLLDFLPISAWSLLVKVLLVKKLVFNLVSEITKMSTFPLTCSIIKSNLFLNKFICK